MSDMETMQFLWTELGQRVRRYVGRRVNDSHAADDITQDVMLKVHSQLDSLPPGDKLAPWMFRIARNAVIDHYRRTRSARTHPELIGPPVIEDAAAEEQEALRELTPCLLPMMRQLPEPYREAMRLADFEGLDQQEIAVRMGISLSGAKSRVQRARRHLRDMLTHCCDIQRDARGGIMEVERTERSDGYCAGDGKAACDR
jgi:RNA polymerase sigma-70 factor (ECF subfamily)